jgi:hypothetical protein
VTWVQPTAEANETVPSTSPANFFSPVDKLENRVFRKGSDRVNWAPARRVPTISHRSTIVSTDSSTRATAVWPCGVIAWRGTSTVNRY